MQTYKIIRFFRAPRKSKIITRGMSLEEAQAHCKRKDTHKKDEWFDGYEQE